MKLSVISGSHRRNAQSVKVASFIRSRIDSGLADESWLFSLSDNPLPLWDESIWSGSERWQRLLDPIKNELASSDGFVIVCPEWHGQVPSGLRNFFLLLSAKEVGHKPALIVTVSSGTGGSYPVAELRMSSYKNNRICYIPEQIVVRHVESVLNPDAGDNDGSADAYFRERIDWALAILVEYAKALRSVRESGRTTHPDFANGM